MHRLQFRNEFFQVLTPQQQQCILMVRPPRAEARQ
jgi:Spy/CpxP family protein refolding chaperone